ncbi:MAG: hypothetical protein HYZ71_05320 [Deltaproteobacteria bacterium]|nr:hypothetical protein [Deltaproteobacteria bacterium]
MVTARHPLQSVFAIIDTGDLDRIWFSAPTRSISTVLRIYKSEASGPKDPDETKRFILQGIRTLKEINFVRTVVMWNDPSCLADEYGLIHEKRGWYAKFRVDEDGDLDEISFHPPERELKTVGGLIIPAGGTVK